MSRRILMTGSHGLVGAAIRPLLETAGYDVVGFDIQADGAERGDIKDAERVRSGVTGCAGIVHLAAVSRVVWAERDPELCWDTNVHGLENILGAASQQDPRPWLLFASSREVYGQPGKLPATEETPLNPVNVYGRSKCEGESMVVSARTNGLRTAIVRLSNVYGRTADHKDRVVPAFAAAAALGRPLSVEGSDNVFDFTHIDDTACGILNLISLLEDGQNVSPIHLLTGSPTTLGELSALAVQIADSDSPVHQATPRSYDVANFFGSPERAAHILNWTPKIDVAEGLSRLIADFRDANLATSP